MIEKLLSRGFIFVGSCNCHGKTSNTYEHPNIPLWRMEAFIDGTVFWVKVLNRPNPNWQIVTSGGVHQFEENLNKYFKI